MNQAESKDIVVIKFGGGLITHKSELKKPNIENLEKLAHTIKELSSAYNVVLVHGAGSYGHLIAKKYGLHLGKNKKFDGIEGITQFDAIDIVRRDMIELNNLVVKCLQAQRIECVPIVPHKNIQGIGMDFQINLEHIKKISEKKVPILWGDVVCCDSPEDFGILSGDDIAARLAIDLDNVSSLVFAMGGADGVMNEPPQNPNSKLIRVLNKNVNFESLHKTDQDVTGGIMYKVKRGLEVSKHIDSVYIVNGEYPERISSAVQGLESIGTRIM